jgi:hypothetical protein
VRDGLANHLWRILRGCYGKVNEESYQMPFSQERQQLSSLARVETNVREALDEESRSQNTAVLRTIVYSFEQGQRLNVLRSRPLVCVKSTLVRAPKRASRPVHD